MAIGQACYCYVSRALCKGAGQAQNRTKEDWTPNGSDDDHAQTSSKVELSLREFATSLGVGVH